NVQTAINGEHLLEALYLVACRPQVAVDMPLEMTQPQKPLHLPPLRNIQQPTQTMDGIADPFAMSRKIRGHQQKCDLLTCCTQLSRHFIGDQPPIAKATEEI